MPETEDCASSKDEPLIEGADDPAMPSDGFLKGEFREYHQ